MSEVKAPLKEAPASSSGVGVAQVYLLGIIIVIGGQYTLWNTGLAAGFYSFLFCTLFLGSGYVCLSLCLSEMIGILPFGGGAYGFARLTLGPTFGYLIGCCESIESILYVTAALVPFGKLISSVIGAPASLEPLWWFLFYVSAMVIHLSGSRAFWTFTSLMGVVVLAVVLMYCFGTIPAWDYQQYVAAPEHHNLQGRSTLVNTYNTMTSLPLAGWWFVGIEGLPLVCSRAADAVKTVPRAIMLAMGTSLLTALALLFCCSAQYPGIIVLSHSSDLNQFLLDYGFSDLFSISRRLAGILSIPAIYSTAFGFTFIYGTQISAMAKSGLFPKILANSWGTHQAPHVALGTGSLIGFVVLIVLHSIKPSLVDHLFNVSMLGSFFVYVSTFTSFVIFRAKYTTLTRNFVNPLGVYSAYFGIFVFCVAFVAVAVFQNDNHAALGAFIVLIGLFVVYYYCVAKKRQYYSPDEQGILLVTYIIKGNKTRKKRRGSSKGPSTPAITRSNQNTPTPHGREITVTTDHLNPSPTPKGFMRHDIKEDDGVVPFAIDATIEEEEDPDPAPPPSMAVSAKPGAANRSSMKAGLSVKPSSKLTRAETYGESQDILGELASFDNYSDDEFQMSDVSVRTEIKQLSMRGQLVMEHHNRAAENWERARGHMVSQKKPAAARLSNLIHKRMHHHHPPPVALNMRSSESHHSNFSFRSTSSHHSNRSLASHRSGYSKYSPSRANHSEPDDPEGAQHHHGRERGHAPESEEMSFRTGRRGSDQSTIGFSVRAPPMQQRNFSHWFSSNRQVAPETSWYLSMRSASNSTTSSASRRIISTINRSISSVNGKVDDIVSAHHDALVENIMNVLPKKDAPNFEKIVDAIVQRMLQEREVDDEAMDAFLEQLGETDEALVIALKYREEVAKRASQQI